MTAAVYVLGGPTSDDRDDFRHSLRSIAANAHDVTEVWAVGDVPDWFAGTTMRLPPLDEKFANQRQSLTRLANYPGAPERFMLFNDDMFVTEPVESPLPVFHLGNAHKFLANRNQHNTWVKAVRATAEWVGSMDLPLYEAHVPLTFDTAALRDLLNTYPADRPFAVGPTYCKAGAGGEGVNAGNAKCKDTDRLTEKLALPMPYLSGNPESWAGVLGDYIRSLFSEPCRWERDLRT